MLRPEYFLANFVPPTEARFSWRAKLADSQMKPMTSDAIGCKDAAIRGPVRAPRLQIVEVISPMLAFLVALILLAGFSQAAPRTATPDIGTVTQAVEAYFASQPGYESGDLITRSQIEKVFSKLEDAGAAVPDAARIAERGLDDSSFVARELSTAAGRKFMRKLAQHPGTFAHLDRLSTIPRGEKLIRDLIRDKDGDKLIEYLATTKGGHKMGNMMAAVPNGGDLNRPTGRIYTVADLVAALRTAWWETSP
jgi:hypothetical protein